MTKTVIRPYDPHKDLDAIQRSWVEIGWLEDEKKAKKAMAQFVKAGSAWVAEFNGAAECYAGSMLGDIRYLEETLSFAAVTAVTNSIIVRKQGLASKVTARLIAQDAAEGALVAGLGIFEQGFYNRLGFGNGSYETLITFDPADLLIEAHFRPPARLSRKDWKAIHQSRLIRARPHGTINIYHPAMSKVELVWEENIFGLGYYDGPAGELTHHVILNALDDVEHGPYYVWWISYQTREQFLELMALLKSFGDQIASIGMEEPPGLQMQDLIKQPFKSRRVTRKGNFETGIRARSFWQMRINDVAGCLAKTHLPHADLRFNLRLSDPIGRYLDEDAPWRGTAGDYIIQLGGNSTAVVGQEATLPTLTATVNAFTRLWLGIRSATALSFTDSLSGPQELLTQLDRVFCLPTPKPDWDF